MVHIRTLCIFTWFSFNKGVHRVLDCPFYFYVYFDLCSVSAPFLSLFPLKWQIVKLSTNDSLMLCDPNFYVTTHSCFYKNKSSLKTKSVPLCFVGLFTLLVLWLVTIRHASYNFVHCLWFPSPCPSQSVPQSPSEETPPPWVRLWTSVFVRFFSSSLSQGPPSFSFASSGRCRFLLQSSSHNDRVSRVFRPPPFCSSLSFCPRRRRPPTCPASFYRHKIK